MKHRIEFEMLPSLEFIHGFLGHDLIHIAARTHDSKSVFKGNHGLMMFVGLYDFIGADTDNKTVALFFGPADYVEMPDVEHIENTGCIPDFIFFHFLKSF